MRLSLHFGPAGKGYDVQLMTGFHVHIYSILSNSTLLKKPRREKEKNEGVEKEEENVIK